MQAFTRNFNEVFNTFDYLRRSLLVENLHTIVLNTHKVNYLRYINHTFNTNAILTCKINYIYNLIDIFITIALNTQSNKHTIIDIIQTALPIKTIGNGDIVFTIVDGIISSQILTIDVLGNLPIKAGTDKNIIGKVSINQINEKNNIKINAVLPTGVNSLGAIWNDNFNITNLPSVQSIQLFNLLPTGTNSIGNFSLNAGNALIGSININQTDNGVQIASGPGFSTNNPLYVNDTAGNFYNNPIFTEAVTSSATIGAININTGVNIIGGITISQLSQGISNGVSLTSLSPGTSLANPVFVSTETGTAIIVKNSGQLSIINLGINNPTIITAPPISIGKQGVLKYLIVSSSVSLKIELLTFNNLGMPTTIFTLFASTDEPLVNWSEVVPGEILTQFNANGTNCGFAIKITNQDNVNNANIYANLSWAEL